MDKDEIVLSRHLPKNLQVDHRLKCANCSHGQAVHNITIYADIEGSTVRNMFNADGTIKNKPLGHLTAYGICSCLEFVRRGKRHV